MASSLGLVDGLGGAATQPLIYVEPEDRITTVTDRKGQVTTVEVNQFGSVIRTVDPLGRETRITRDDQNLATRVERPSDSAPGGVRVDTIAYDDLGNVTTLTEAVGTPAERSKQYEYEPVYSKVTRMVDPDGFAKLYAYDGFGELISLTDAEGGEKQFSYEPDGKLASRTDENGNTTAFAYNALRNVASITHADGSVTGMTYDAAGNTTVVAEAQGSPVERQVQRTFDALNRVLTVEVTGADGVQIDGVTSFTYLPAGNIETVTDETGLVTSMGYDALERLVAVNYPGEGLVQRSFNEAGEVVSYVSGDGATHIYAYDAVSRLSEMTDTEGYVKSFAYDVRDNITSVIDGGGRQTVFGFDVYDRLVSRTNPLGLTMQRTYDSRDNLLSLTREDGSVETASYDGLSRRTQLVTPDNVLTYRYDPRGNLIEATDADSRVSFTYDERNRLQSSTTDGTVGPQPQVTLSYSYDALDRRISVSDSLGGTTGYAYDPEGRLTDLIAPWGATHSFGYDGQGRRTSLTSTSGRASSYAFTNGLLSALQHAQSGVALADLVYEYGADGQLSAIIDNLDPAQSRFISYDNLNRLIQVDEGIPAVDGGTPVPVEDYAFDEEGNRLSSHLSAIYVSNDHNQLTEDDSYTYAYDQKGNRISRTSKATGDVETYSYDSQNRLVGYQSPSTVASYAYDALDRRISKTVDGETTSYVYDASILRWMEHDDILLEFSGAGSTAQLAKRWLHTDEVDEALAFEEYAGGVSAPGDGNVYAMYADRIGSISHVVEESTNTLAAAYEYDSFGQRSQFAGALFQYYGYSGRESDPESGLVYLRNRYYDPSAGVFIASDPLGFASQTLNIYGYVDNNPYNLTDPNGLQARAGRLGFTGMQAEMGLLLTQGAQMARGAVGRIGMGLIGPLDRIIRSLAMMSKMVGDSAAGSDSGADGGDGGQCEGPGGGGGGDGPSWWEKAKKELRAIFARMMIVGGSLFGDDPTQEGYQWNPTDEIVQAERTRRDIERYQENLKRAREAEENSRDGGGDC